MAVQGEFRADFTQFNAAIESAVGRLRSFQVTSSTTEQGLVKTDAATVRSATTFGQLATGLSAADKTLNAFGVHLGPQIHALNEMAEASGKTASQIGLIGTASLVAAAAIGSWEMGRAVAKFFDLDKAISNNAAAWMGWGDLAAETAGAKQDVINRAIDKGASATINYTAAVKYLITAGKEEIAAEKERAKAVEDAADARAKALEKERAATEAYSKHLGDIQSKLMGTDQITKAQDYMKTFMDVKNVTSLNSDALAEFNDVLTAGFSRLVEQGGAASEMAADMNRWRLAVIEAQQTHTVAVTQMESDEDRLARESAELAKAMSDNFAIIGRSAQDAAQQTIDSWSDAMDLVRSGQGTMSGTIQGIAPGAAGSSVRYDDYGNPYGYIPGVNLPGRMTPGGITINAQESFFDTPSSIQRLADKVFAAQHTRFQSQGGR